MSFVPELGLDLSSTAIGKDYKKLTEFIGKSPSGSGLQVSLFGLLGLTVAIEEGIELNILGLNFELDLFDFAIELPGIGRIGPAAATLPDPNGFSLGVSDMSIVKANVKTKTNTSTEKTQPADGVR